MVRLRDKRSLDYQEWARYPLFLVDSYYVNWRRCQRHPDLHQKSADHQEKEKEDDVARAAAGWSVLVLAVARELIQRLILVVRRIRAPVWISFRHNETLPVLAWSMLNVQSPEPRRSQDGRGSRLRSSLLSPTTASWTSIRLLLTLYLYYMDGRPWPSITSWRTVLVLV